MAQTLKLVKYVQVAADDMGVKHGPVIIRGDNKAALKWSSSHATPVATKYFLPELRWVQNTAEQLNASVLYTRSAANLADIGTKYLSRPLPHPLRQALLGYAPLSTWGPFD